MRAYGKSIIPKSRADAAMRFSFSAVVRIVGSIEPSTQDPPVDSFGMRSFCLVVALLLFLFYRKEDEIIEQHEHENERGRSGGEKENKLIMMFIR